MNRIIDPKNQTPAYLQLYDQIKYDIVNEIYRYGSKLPSKRVMAAEAGVSIITVEHTYALLCDEGYIEARQRSGFFVVFRSSEGFASSAGKPVSHNAHTSCRSSLLEFPFSVLTRIMRRVLNDYGQAILDKSPNSGCTELREALRIYLAGNRGIYVDIDQIVIGSGAEYLYSLIVGMLGRDRLYALECPSYEKIEQVYRAAGATCDLLPLDSDGIESPALNKTEATVLHISPYRSFPTGITASASKRYEYIRWAEQSSRVIVEDDFQSEFSVASKPEETLFSLSKKDNVIYLNTFSQTISPSLRVGYMILPKNLVQRFLHTVGFFSCTVPTFEQLVLAELISGGDFARHINRVRRAKRKKLL